MFELVCCLFRAIFWCVYALTCRAPAFDAAGRQEEGYVARLAEYVATDPGMAKCGVLERDGHICPRKRGPPNVEKCVFRVDACGGHGRPKIKRADSVFVKLIRK